MTTTMQPQVTTQPVQEEKIILEFLENMAQAFADRDVDAIMNCYTAQPLVVLRPGQAFTDRNQIRAIFSEMLEDANGPQIQFHNHLVLVSGNQAMHYADWSMKGVAPDGTPVTDGGLTSVLLERQPAGNWLIVFDNPYAGHVGRNQ